MQNCTGVRKHIMEINRVWAMPNRWTFEIKPIRKLIYKYGGDFKGWIDPFAGMNSPAEIRNDLNPDMPAEYHLHAKEFAEQLTGQYNGCLFDNPYSNRQIKECYESIGLRFEQEDSQGLFQKEKKIFAPLIRTGGYVICFGWSSNGFGKQLGFEIIEILLVSHGGAHNDTIVTVEQKFQDKLF